MIGRTQILVVSINVRKGLSHLGAPPGNKPAKTSVGDVVTPERIRANHNGNPKERVKRRWEVALNIYGSIPEKFIRIIKTNKLEKIKDIPLRLSVKVRDVWSCIIFDSE